ncbi:MAG: ABC transporter permease [Acidobacteriota bacterium]
MPEWKPDIRKRLASLSLEPARENEIVEEFAQHLEDRYQEMLAGGASHEEADRAARTELSDPQLLVRELNRLERQTGNEPFALGTRRNNMLGNLWQDLRYGLRLIRKNPGFSAVVVLTLAVGIGANTAIFSVVNAVMLRSLPFKDPDRLVRLNESNPERGWPTFSVSHPNFLDWRDQNQTFEAMAATTGASVNLGAAGEVEVVRGSAVTVDFLTVLGTSPLMGRNFLPEEDKPGGNTRVVMLTYGSWQKRFGGDRDVVGKTLTLNDNIFTIVGVLPESFAWSSGSNFEILMPLAPDPARPRGDHRLLVIGKLKEGVSREQALSDLNTIAARLADQYPESNKGWLVSGQSFYDWMIPEPIRRSLLLFLGAVVVVLLIACSNVANLMLARATARQKEISIRIALGASRLRIASQLLVEALSLAMISGIAGLGVAWLATKALKALDSGDVPRLDELSMDGRVLGFSLLISLVTGVLFGLAPAIHAARTNLNEMLKEGGRSVTGGRVRQRIRNLLVTVEVGLSVALLVSAGLLLRSFWRLQDVNPGFKTDHLLTMRINLPRTRYQDNARAWGFYKRLVEETGAVPGIQSVGVTSGVPMGGGNTATQIQIEGKPPAPDGSKPSADWRIVSTGYFATMGIPLRGREFDERDTEDSQPVTIISDEMARRYWPDEDAIGKLVVLFSFSNKPCTIVGVAGDVRSLALDSDPNPMVYVSTGIAATWNPMNLVIRTSGEPAAQVSAVRSTLGSIDPNVPVYDARTVDELLSNSLGSRRFTMFLLGTFAAVALLLACVGLFGVMAYLVSQRTHEIGVRLALGARPRDVFRLIIGRGMALAAGGSVLGLAGAWAIGRFLESMLYQIKPSDPITLASAPLLLLAVALLACYVPARRAMRVDPMVALRYE